MPAEPFHGDFFSDKYLHRNLERKAAFVERTPVIRIDHSHLADLVSLRKYALTPSRVSRSVKF